MNVIYDIRTNAILHSDQDTTPHRSSTITSIRPEVGNLNKAHFFCNNVQLDDIKKYKVIFAGMNRRAVGFENVTTGEKIIADDFVMRKNKVDEIIWCGPFTDAGSYSHINRKFAFGLADRGHKVSLEIVRMATGPQIPKHEYERVLDLQAPTFPAKADNAIKIICYLPLGRATATNHNIFFTMMETSTINPTFTMFCNSYCNEVWSPSNNLKQLFVDSKIKSPINVMPLGVDHEQFSPNGVAPKLNYEIINAKFSNQSFSPQPSGFKFLSVFRWSYRKGPDVLIKAFLDEFKRGDDVSLVLMSRHPMCVQNDSTINSVRNEIIKFVTMYGINDNSPPIYWCHDIIPDEVMPSVFNIADCYVSTSRGEGWGLPNIEAGCCEIPVICPNHTGHDYAKEEFVYPIGVDDLEICNNVPEWKPWITKNFFGQKFPVYGHKIVDKVRSHMRHVINNNTEAKDKAGRFRRFILENYTWKKCIDNIENRVSEVLKGLNK